jgi:hypothetical protein
MPFPFAQSDPPCHGVDPPGAPTHALMILLARQRLPCESDVPVPVWRRKFQLKLRREALLGQVVADDQIAAWASCPGGEQTCDLSIQLEGGADPHAPTAIAVLRALAVVRAKDADQHLAPVMFELLHHFREGSSPRFLFDAGRGSDLLLAKIPGMVPIIRPSRRAHSPDDEGEARRGRMKRRTTDSS